jgi:lipoate-protein ligase B
MRVCRAIQLGTMPYRDAFDLQKEIVAALQSREGNDVLLLLEHPHVVTLGRNATGEALLADEGLLAARGVELVATDRGGDVTYHGPGQLVGYPLLGLEGPERDIRRYVHRVEEVLIRTLSDFGIDAQRHPVHRGVWTGGKKIASIGIRISRWVTCHGFALNVNTDLSYFSLITPCGIAGCEMTSMEELKGRSVDMASVMHRVTDHFCGVFDRRVERETSTIETAENHAR